MHKAIFIDRDGVINEWKMPPPDCKPEDFYIIRWDQFEFSAGVFDAFQLIADLDYIPIVVSNQSGIGRGIVDDDINAGYWAIFAIFSKMASIIFEVTLCHVFTYFCPHKPESNCACRKPKPGMLYSAAVDLDIDLGNSWMIGDQETDLHAGYAAGIPNLIMISDMANEIKQPMPIIHPAYTLWSKGEPTVPMMKSTDTVLKVSLLEAIQHIAVQNVTQN